MSVAGDARQIGPVYDYSHFLTHWSFASILERELKASLVNHDFPKNEVQDLDIERRAKSPETLHKLDVERFLGGCLKCDRKRPVC
jgi:hypothetical protein